MRYEAFINTISSSLGQVEIDKTVHVEGYDMENERLALILSNLLPSRDLGAVLILEEEMKSEAIENIMRDFNRTIKGAWEYAENTSSAMVAWWILTSDYGRSAIELLMSGNIHPFSARYILENFNEYHQRILLGNKKLGYQSLCVLAKSRDTETAIRVANHPNSKKALLLNLIRHPIGVVAQTAMANPNLPCENIVELLKTSQWVRKLTGNPNMKEEWMQEILLNKENSKLLFTSYAFSQERLYDANKGIIDNPSLSEASAKLLLGHPDPEIRRYMAIREVPWQNIESRNTL